MKYRSCTNIEVCSLNINGLINNDKPVIALCCEGIASRPMVAFAETPEKTLSDFRKMCAEVIGQSYNNALLSAIGEDTPPHRCSKCPNFILWDWNNFDGIIKYVNISSYPSPCQCKCIYCNLRNGESNRLSLERDSVYYDRMFEFLEYADSVGAISPDAVWQVSCGEITIHPYKKRIIDMVKKHTPAFYTNCFIYDEDIAEILKTNPDSTINLSIDSGTPETWAKIKGVDNFTEVIENLYKYASICQKPEQITLKYINLPGINDNWNDHFGVVKIIKDLKIKTIALGRDVNIKYNSSPEQLNNVIGAAAYFIAITSKNEISCSNLGYTPDEIENAIAFGRHLLENGVV
ncbi:MAG: radical SAM protein [Ruminococcus sp.]|jgi:wyosine [tRNA(Phe)-imidazoG37] synthetase (radical SAM superfamily)|nr:radical SAM protein [Ruminococcus sp.]